MLDIATVDKQLTLLRKYKGLLENQKKVTFEEFKSTSEINASIERYLQLAIECCLNIGNHIIASEGLERPEDYAGIPRILEKRGIVQKDFADELVKMVKFRNRLVHLYWETDPREVYEILQTKTGDFQKFAECIVKYVEKETSSNQ